MKSVFALFGLALLATAAWMGLDPGGFYESVATFGPQSDHFVRDLATYTAPLGVALIVAAWRTSWRLPVLVLGLLQNGLHVVSHVVDLDTASTTALGVGTLVGLVLLEVVLIALVGAVLRDRPGRHDDAELEAA